MMLNRFAYYYGKKVKCIFLEPSQPSCMTRNLFGWPTLDKNKRKKKKEATDKA